MQKYFILIVALPLLGFLINIFFGKKINSEKFSGWLSSLFVLIPFLIGISMLFQLLKLPPESRKIVFNYFNWISVGNFNVDYSFLIDPLSLVMILVVTGIGFLIHVYSIGYMHGDDGFARFF